MPSNLYKLSLILIDNFVNIIFVASLSVSLHNLLDLYICIYKGVDVVDWSRALDVSLSEWCCSVSMV
jgi:hypothetical protein